MPGLLDVASRERAVSAAPPARTYLIRSPKSRAFPAISLIMEPSCSLHP